jgi:hypothetical protein
MQCTICSALLAPIHVHAIGNRGLGEPFPVGAPAFRCTECGREYLPNGALIPPRSIELFHGTSMANAEKILREGFEGPSFLCGGASFSSTPDGNFGARSTECFVVVEFPADEVAKWRVQDSVGAIDDVFCIPLVVVNALRERFRVEYPMLG